MEAAAFLALHGLAHDDVASIDHVAELADFHIDLRAEEEFLCFLVEVVEARPGTLQSQVRADDADIGLHDLLHLGLRVADEVELLVWYGTRIDPVRNVFTERELGDAWDGMLGSEVGIDDCLDELFVAN